MVSVDPTLGFISTWHIIVLLAIVLLIFGGKKLPELARGIGRGLRIFRDEMHGVTKDVERSLDDDTAPADKPQATQLDEKK